MTLTLRRAARPLVLATLALGAGRAHAYELTSGCDALISDPDRALLDQAVDWLDEERSSILVEIIRDRSGPDNHLYSSFTSSDEAAFEGELDQFLTGGTKLDCHPSDSTNDCGLATGLLGWTRGDLFNIHLCFANIRSTAATNEDNVRAAIAHTVAHELMHHADGNDDHGSDGATNFADPDTRAETIGVAVEHLMLTPDLDPRYLGVTQGFAAGAHQVTLDYAVANTNGFSHNNDGFLPMSFDDRNPSTRTCLRQDGAGAGSTTLGDVDGDTEDAESHLFVVPAFDPAASSGLHELEVFADCDDVALELDESDNGFTSVVSAAMDLAIDVELYAAPVFMTGTRAGVPGIQRWFRLQYRVTASNLDTDTTAPVVDATLVHDEAWLGGTRTTSANVGPVPPGASQSVVLTLDVPANFAGTLPVGATDLTFRLDGGVRQSHDRDWSNNSASFVIDTSYWRPDYRISVFDDLPPSGSSKPYALRVKNFGPVAATASSLIDVQGDGVHSPSSITIGGLGILGEAGPFTVTLTAPPACFAPKTYAIEVDAGAAVTESDETNNDLVVSLGHYCSPDEIFPLFASGFEPHLVEEVLYEQLVLTDIPQEWTWHSAREFVQWFFDQQSNGPFFPEIPPDYVLSYRHLLHQAHMSPIYALYSASSPGPIRSLRAGTPPQDLSVFVSGRAHLEQTVPFEYGLPQ